jgi:hypothetical protein
MLTPASTGTTISARNPVVARPPTTLARNRPSMPPATSAPAHAATPLGASQRSTGTSRERTWGTTNSGKLYCPRAGVSGARRDPATGGRRVAADRDGEGRAGCAALARGRLHLLHAHARELRAAWGRCMVRALIGRFAIQRFHKARIRGCADR